MHQPRPTGLDMMAPAAATSIQQLTPEMQQSMWCLKSEDKERYK